MAKLLWEWKPRFAVALVVRDLLIMMSHTNCDVTIAVLSSCVVTQTPMGTNSGTRRRKRKFPLLFVNCDRGRIEIDHLYSLRCRGWYCNPEQHSLCRPQAAARWPAQLVLLRIAVPTTPAQTVSWSIPIPTFFRVTLLALGQLYAWWHMLRYWPFVQGIYWSPVNFSHNGQWHRVLIFSLIRAWINGWENNHERDDFRRHCTHYDVTVMDCNSAHEVTLKGMATMK